MTFVAVEAFFKVLVRLQFLIVSFYGISEPLPSVSFLNISLAKTSSEPKLSLGQKVVRECHSPEA